MVMSKKMKGGSFGKTNTIPIVVSTTTVNSTVVGGKR